MSDLEQRIRDVLHDDARSAPPPHDPGRVLGRTRRRQVGAVVASAAGVVALVAASVVAFRAIGTGDGTTPLDRPVVTSTISGITISHPEGWFVADPEEAGLNGPALPPDSMPTLPRLVMAVAPFDPGELFACPGQAGRPHAFLMTIQEEPLALAGPGAGSWPAALQPLDVGTSESACYPGWEFLRAGWTASDRTFEARLGLAPDVAEEERDALLAAFASMTFGQAGAGAESAVLATGTAGAQEWQLVATRGSQGLQLAVEAESSSTGIGGFTEAAPGALHLSDLVLGDGEEAERVVFGPAPAAAVRIGVRQIPDDELMIEVIDVPEEIDPELNAFVFTLPADRGASVVAYDEAGDVIASGELDPELGPIPPGHPTETPPPLDVIVPDDVEPVHGGEIWGLYLAVSSSPDDPAIDAAIQQAEELGYNPSSGDISCDDGAAEGLGVTASVTYGVTVYFDTREDAEAALRFVHRSYGVEPAGVVRVTTYCLD